MGAGASAAKRGEPLFGPDLEAGGELNYDAEWRSEMSKDLDRLGGILRPPIKRGLSQKFLLEWLKDAVHEQGDRLEEALARDPNAGRQELARQEQMKLAKQMGNNLHRFSVREWQTMRHTDLRALQAREEAERKAREAARLANGGEPERPEVTAYRWVQANNPDNNRKLAAVYAAAQENTGRAGAMMSTDMPTAEWRVRVSRARRRAMMIIAVVLAFRGRKHRARGLQRLDSLSFFIAQHLGPELPRFVDEQGSYRATKAMAEEGWRGDGGEAGADPDTAVAAAAGSGAAGGSISAPTPSLSPPHSGPLADLTFTLGGRPSSPRPQSVAGYSYSSGSSQLGGYRSLQPPPLRLPGTSSGSGPVGQGGGGGGGGGGAAAAGSGGGGQVPGSPLLRSRPVNLTPSLHHISQASGSVFGGEHPGGAGSFLGEREHILGVAGPVRRMVIDGTGDQLFQRSQEEQTQALERPMRMMQMYANRANARWVEELAGGSAAASAATPPSPSSASSPSGAGGGGGGGGGWEPPHVYDASRFAAAVGGAQSSAFKAEVVSMFKAGKIAVQLLAGDDQILLSNGQTQALWSADPWDLIASAFPAKHSET
ncbi:hypothetical protein GPECTOR_3g273 [Gonium pectorale]|uniref:Uncharacterized protein n=1 Tax=Gonium pectorale TaxID=33097 RepID=A0A150GZ61_GONPE|nr:hypothetical protein GPECTOR_3g273 [Gonium pectorale]|eukprot:KXZ55121.1 hypothetical protein GPECTOR_3g273 [Gonium pectorale]